MVWAVDTLRKAKFWSSRTLSPRLYWYLMGKLRPVLAVTSECGTIEDSMQSGRKVVQLLNQLSVVGPDMVTLHIGSGLGRVEYHLRSQVRHCWGVDVSPSMVKRARRLVPYSNVEFVLSDGSTLSHWQDGTFDLIYSFLVFQHLPRPQFDRYLGEAWDKLSPGGHLVFHVLIDESGSFADPPPSHPYGLRYYRRRDIEDKLGQAGFILMSQCNLEGKPDNETLAVGDVVFSVLKP